jgi:hypothetical protein
MPFEVRFTRVQQLLGSRSGSLVLGKSTVSLAKPLYISAVVNSAKDRREMLPEPPTAHAVTYCTIKSIKGLKRLQEDVRKNGHGGLVFRHPEGLFDDAKSGGSLTWFPVRHSYVEICRSRTDKRNGVTVYTVQERIHHLNELPFTILKRGGDPPRRGLFGLVAILYRDRDVNGIPLEARFRD